jgi:magnesium-transporting ATPase (P-type)
MATSEPHPSSFLSSQYRHVRQCIKEARFVALTWISALLFCGCWIRYFGYIPPADRPEVPALVLGIPSWVVWGLLVPWIALILVTWFFAAFILKDDEPLQPMPGFEETLPCPEGKNGTRKAEKGDAP